MKKGILRSFAFVCVLLTVSVAYSIGLDRRIQNTIKSEMDESQSG